MKNLLTVLLLRSPFTILQKVSKVLICEEIEICFETKLEADQINSCRIAVDMITSVSMLLCSFLVPKLNNKW